MTRFLRNPIPGAATCLLTPASTSRSKFKHWCLFTQGHCYHLSVQDVPQETSTSCLSSRNNKGLQSYLKHEDYSTQDTTDYKRMIGRPGPVKLFHAYTFDTCKTLGTMISSVMLLAAYGLILLQVRRTSIHLKFYLLPGPSLTAWAYTISGQQTVRILFFLC